MKLISLNRYISLLILIISFLPLHAEEEIDIWNKENKENINSNQNINSTNITATPKINIPTQINNNIEIENEISKASQDIKIFGIYDPAENDFDLNENSVIDSSIKEVYINRSTGETLTETIGKLSIADDDIIIQSEENANKDDGWFSGDFPTYSQTTNKPAIEKQFPAKKDTIIQNEKPVLVESFPKREMRKKKNWKNIFNICTILVSDN